MFTFVVAAMTLLVRPFPMSIDALEVVPPLIYSYPKIHDAVICVESEVLRFSSSALDLWF